MKILRFLCVLALLLSVAGAQGDPIRALLITGRLLP